MERFRELMWRARAKAPDKRRFAAIKALPGGYV
jgi:hypothetical protein